MAQSRPMIQTPRFNPAKLDEYFIHCTSLCHLRQVPLRVATRDVHRRMVLESFDQNALAIDVDEPLGPPHAPESSAPRPIESGIAQGAAHRPVLDHVRVVEEGHWRFAWVILVVAAVVEHGETTHHLVPLQRHEEGGLRVLIEGVAVRVELDAYL